MKTAEMRFTDQANRISNMKKELAAQRDKELRHFVDNVLEPAMDEAETQSKRLAVRKALPAILSFSLDDIYETLASEYLEPEGYSCEMLKERINGDILPTYFIKVSWKPKNYPHDYYKG